MLCNVSSTTKRSTCHKNIQFKTVIQVKGWFICCWSHLRIWLPFVKQLSYIFLYLTEGPGAQICFHQEDWVEKEALTSNASCAGFYKWAEFILRFPVCRKGCWKDFSFQMPYLLPCRMCEIVKLLLHVLIGLANTYACTSHTRQWKIIIIQRD